MASMTARADISNARREKLEERSKTAWDKGEALPPFYREILEEGVRRGDVVSKSRFEELCRVIEASGDHYKELETELREAEKTTAVQDGVIRGQAIRIGELENQLREAEIADREWVQHTQELGDELREADGRMGEALSLALNVHGADSWIGQKFLSILGGTEKEGDRVD